MHPGPQSDSQPKTIYLADYQPPLFWVDEIHLHFNLHQDETIVTSHLWARHNRHAGSESRDWLLNGDELQLLSILMDGKKLESNAYTLHESGLIIHHLPDTFELEMTTKISPQKNTALSGLYLSGKTGTKKFCTQCEAEGFRRITYYPDHPDVLARFSTTIEADAAPYPYLLSNGNCIESGQLPNGRHWAKWEDPFKKPCYLFALVAGDFDLIEDKFTTQSGRDVTLRIYVEKGYADQAHHAMFALKQAMRWDEEAYGREYDLDIFMIAAISDFNMGAMENKGLNIFNTKYVLARPETATDDDYIHILSVVAHEYFHNWTGNRVTCRDWFQLSLKEGLTIFRDQSFSEDTLSRSVMRILDVTALRETQFPEDAGPLAHPVRPDSYMEINNFYTATIYNKGAEVLRMLRTILGKPLFRKGMDLYFARYDGQAVTIEDFVKTMEDVSGIDLTQFRRWYGQAGTPVVTVCDDYDATRQIYTLTITQHTPPTPGQPEKLPLHIPISIGLLADNGKEIFLQREGELSEPEKVLDMTQSSQQFQFNHVASKPIPSLLRGFSAPVKLRYDYAEEDLLFLLKHDRDPFNRWEASQQVGLRIALGLVEDYQREKKFLLSPAWSQALSHLLRHDIQDPMLLAEMLTLPSEKYIGEQMEVIDVDAIHAAREFILTELARQLSPLLLEVYQRFHETGAVNAFDMRGVGRRRLKNQALQYLMKSAAGAPLAVKQFEQALPVNMTDTLAALTGLVNADAPLRETALAQFYSQWKDDTLVLDKWFAIQALWQSPDILHRVKTLTRHEAFDIKNPNKVYSLIGTFGARNPAQFHQASGEGYRFLREMVQQLDSLNPQVAARMVKPLTSWKRYDKQRQELMLEQLETILKGNKLSSDLYEIASKSLETRI